MADMDEVMDARDAAQYLKINEQTLRRLARDNQLPSFKVGGTWRFKRSSLDRWAEGQQEQREPKSILVVDDDEGVCRLLGHVLSREGYRITTALGGAQALELMREQVPDAVFLDMKMPGMSGPETLQAIREQHGMVPVVILTGYPDGDMVAEALKHSPVLLLAKPATNEQIAEAAKAAVA